MDDLPPPPVEGVDPEGMPGAARLN
jgi:hypothetical protein